MQTNVSEPIKIIESPRDAFQGIKEFIPTEKKISFINSLLQCGFDVVEAGSFVSKSVIPQMRDTEEVIRGLDLSGTESKIMVLVGSRKGFSKALEFDEIDYIAFPYSASAQFLARNIYRCPKEALNDIEYFSNEASKRSKKMIIYLTMAFGNPYGDAWNPAIIRQETEELVKRGIDNIPLSDITGEAGAERIKAIYSMLEDSFRDVCFGLHLHLKPEDCQAKLEAAWEAGCRRFDTVVNGMGGCPMTGMDMMANLDTLQLISFLEIKKLPHNLNMDQLKKSSLAATQFPA